MQSQEPMQENEILELLQIARLYQRRNQFAQAERVFEKVFELQSVDERFETVETALALYYKGDLLIQAGKSSQAIPYFKMALRVWSKLADQEEVPEALRTRAEIFLQSQAREIVARAAEVSGIDTTSNLHGLGTKQ
jgi:tetratricopeptide (TPR) repeat protein